MASGDAKKPRCASPTLVHTRTSGSAIATSVLISPAWFMPSSITATSGLARSCISDSGRPMWLFRFPLFFTTRKRVASSSAIGFLRRRLARAAGDRDHPRLRGHPHRVRQVLQRPQRVVHLDDAARRVAPSRTRPHPASTIAPAAPRREHLGDELVAVEPRSLQRHEQVAGRSARLSVTTSPIAQLGLARPQRAADRLRDPPEGQFELVHPARDFTRRASSASRATATSSNGQRPSADLLVLLVALAGDQHDVARAGVAHRLQNRLATIDHR